jgi:hypothetical protein
MNVENFKPKIMEKSDSFEEMIQEQTELMRRYHVQEKHTRFTDDWPVDLDDQAGQLLLKDFAWRTTEEVGEALSALLEEGPASSIVLHSKEEIADAFHFFIEFIILSDIKVFRSYLDKELERINPGSDGCENQIPIYEGDIAIPDTLTLIFRAAFDTRKYQLSKKGETLEFIRQLAMVCNTLKNKQWKQDHILTDRNLFYTRLVETLFQFCRMSLVFGLNSQGLYDVYFRKAQVNKFRQESNY